MVGFRKVFSNGNLEFRMPANRNRQDFSHREADAKSLLDEVLRRGREERKGRVGGVSTDNDG